MNDFAKTVLAVVLAAGLATAAYVSAPKPIADATFSDAGEVFFPTFNDPLAAKSLEILGFDEPTATLTPFNVKFDGTRWVIPSHHNYPADAEANMSSASSAFIGLKKDTVITDKASEHQSLGVLAPDDDKAPLSGRGTRVTLKNGAGETLADLIIGKPVVSAQVGGQVYARVPGKNRVYAVNFTKVVTTKFADWVQTDVLKLGAAEVSGLSVDRYKIDETAFTKTTTETVTISKAPPPAVPPQPASPDAPPPPVQRWTFTATPGGGPGPGEIVLDAPIDDAVGTLRSMKILGVRPKSEKLVKFFAGNAAEVRLNSLDLMGMTNKGFYVTQDGQFVANEGETDVRCDDGVVYKLYFGELLVATGDELSAGAEPASGDAAKPEDAAKAAADKKNATEARYVLATVSFDQSLLGPAPVPPTPPSPPEGYDPAAKPTDPPTPDSPEVAAYKSAKAKYDADLATYQQTSNAFNARVDGGKNRYEQLKKSLANWYYVIDSPSFEKLRPTRASLVQAQPAAPSENTAAPAPPTPPGL